MPCWCRSLRDSTTTPARVLDDLLAFAETEQVDRPRERDQRVLNRLVGLVDAHRHGS
jgi:hypothetical protein